LSEVERQQCYLDKLLEPRVLKGLILQCLHDGSKLRPVIVEVLYVKQWEALSLGNTWGSNVLDFEEHLNMEKMRANKKELSAALQGTNK